MDSIKVDRAKVANPHDRRHKPINIHKNHASHDLNHRDRHQLDAGRYRENRGNDALSALRFYLYYVFSSGCGYIDTLGRGFGGTGDRHYGGFDGK